VRARSCGEPQELTTYSEPWACTGWARDTRPERSLGAASASALGGSAGERAAWGCKSGTTAAVCVAESWSRLLLAADWKRKEVAEERKRRGRRRRCLLVLLLVCSLLRVFELKSVGTGRETREGRRNCCESLLITCVLSVHEWMHVLLLIACMIAVYEWILLSEKGAR
jgi:hypothetical protein